MNELDELHKEDENKEKEIAHMMIEQLTKERENQWRKIKDLKK